MTSSFFDRLATIDEFIAVGPSRCDFEQDVQPLLLEPASTEYFCSHLQDPAWLGVLAQAGRFAAPPQLRRDPDTGSVAYPAWPESRLLARMALVTPKTVHEIALEIPETENTVVHTDLADAALQMPVELAKDFVPKARRWLDSPNALLLAEKLGQLVSRLASGGGVEAALDLARTLLAVIPDEGVSSPQPRARFNDWEYERILRDNIPDLREVAPEPTLVLLCDLLSEALRLSERDGQQNRADGTSFIWRPAIENHAQNASHMGGLRDLLVTAVRDTAEALIEGGRPGALGIVEGHKLKVFQRIGLHLRRKYPEVDPEGTVNLLTDAQVFDDICLHHEFFCLLAEQFGSLSSDAQNGYLSLVRRGPDLDRAITSWRERTGERPSADEIEARHRHWQHEKLWPIRQSLQGGWRELSGRLVEEFGEPEHPDLLVYSSGVLQGPTSPRSAQEMGEMSTDELLGFLRTPLQVSGSSMDSMHGVGRQLKELAASEPKRFAGEAQRFRELDPTYVRSLIEGLTEALKRNRSFSWTPAIELCQWVIEQPREIPSREVDAMEADADWGATRLAIARLLSAGFEPGDCQMPVEHRTATWSVLTVLAEDAEPTPEYEARYGGLNMDPATLSINTTRGEAMHAVVRYALWVRRHSAAGPGGEPHAEQSFGDMPEFRRVLDEHLDPAKDPSAAIRAVYGQHFPQLARLDEEWVAQNVSVIFPTDNSLRDLLDAAWDTYVTFNRAYDEVYSLLAGEYERAVERVGLARLSTARFADPDEQLAGHLMALYWRGRLELSVPRGLLARFYRKAGDPLRAHALAFVGRALKATSDEVPPQIIARLQQLWEWRLEAARQAESTSLYSEELAAFGWWFISGKFGDDWAIAQLAEALDLSGWAEPDHMVIERVASLAAKMPHLAVRCLASMAGSDKPSWHFHGWGDAPKTILAEAIDSCNQAAREAAIQEVHRFGARGYLGYRDLLHGRAE